jgi:hypothetical protein
VPAPPQYASCVSQNNQINFEEKDVTPQRRNQKIQQRRSEVNEEEGKPYEPKRIASSGLQAAEEEEETRIASLTASSSGRPAARKKKERTAH